ncbi:hypothetical protein [Microcoleus sp. Pol12B4]|uniref:hypothetical protein n=1 Tax=Microcoleus sp. Pol12B4 TaxID=3055395 RepID=UPI002FD59DCC
MGVAHKIAHKIEHFWLDKPLIPNDNGRNIKRKCRNLTLAVFYPVTLITVYFNKLSHVLTEWIKGGILMVGFGDKFKSIVNQAQQKVTDIQNSEQMKGIVGQLKEKVTEYSELAQTKLEEYEEYIAKSETQKIESGSLPQTKTEEDQNNSETQGLQSAALAQIKTGENRRNSEQLKALVGHIKEKVTEYSDTAFSAVMRYNSNS